jgi:predicted transposase YbfD/YdcC
MDVGASRGVLRLLGLVEDPRMNRTKLHSLTDILFVTLCGVLGGADSWTEIALFGRSKLEWLRRYLPLTNGIPSHDTFGRVFARLDPVQLENCFLQWMSALAQTTDGRLIAIDGKTIRRSFDQASGKAAIHMVSAWCEASRLVLGQVATEEKSNEITAIPRLLEMLDVRSAVVTIDAMGCQKAIAKKIIEEKGHYVLQLKENQASLHALVKETFDELTGRGIPCVRYKYHEETDAGHGRVETRRIWTTDCVGGVEEFRVRGEYPPSGREAIPRATLLHQRPGRPGRQGHVELCPRALGHREQSALVLGYDLPGRHPAESGRPLSREPVPYPPPSLESAPPG